MMGNRTSLRAWFCLSLATVTGGAAWSAWGLLRVTSAFRNAEASGLLSVARGIAEANQLLIASLYVGVICAVIAVFAYLRAHNAPPVSLVLSSSFVALVPVALIWLAESLLLDALPFARDGVIANGTLIQRLLYVALVSGIVLSVLFLFVWALRVSPAVTPRRTVAAVALLIACFVTAAIGLHLRNAWIDDLYTRVNSQRPWILVR
jgi:hypothetical protein